MTDPADPPVSDLDPAPDLDLAPDPVSELDPAPDLDLAPDPVSELDPAPDLVPAPDPVSELDPAPDLVPAPDPVSDLDPAPDLDPVSDPGPGSGLGSGVGSDEPAEPAGAELGEAGGAGAVATGAGGVVAAAEPARRGRWPEPGPVADEAARLAEVASDWARRAVPELAAVLRGDRPEVTGKLIEAGNAVAAAARAVLDTLVRPPPAHPVADQPAEQPPPPGPRVEPIDVE